MSKDEIYQKYLEELAESGELDPKIEAFLKRCSTSDEKIQQIKKRHEQFEEFKKQVERSKASSKLHNEKETEKQ